MSFFNSLRRRSNPAYQNDDEPTTKTPPSIRSRTLTRWATSPRRRQGIAWDDDMYKSEDVCETKMDVVKVKTCPEYGSQSPEQIASIPSLLPCVDQSQQPMKQRGRSISRGKPSLFSGQHHKSKSRSPSISSARNFLHKAAELVKTPSVFFHKAKASDDASKPLVTSSSPTRSIRSRKSVHFTPYDNEEEDGVITPNSPTPMPGSSAPSLPPFDLSTSTLMNIGDPNVAVLTAEPPPKPVAEALKMDVANIDAVLGGTTLLVTPQHNLREVAVSEEKFGRQHDSSSYLDPTTESSTNAVQRLDTSLAQSTRARSNDNRLTRELVDQDATLCKQDAALSKHCCIDTGTQTDDGMENPFNTPIESHIDTAGSSVLVAVQEVKVDNDLEASTKLEVGAKTFSNVSLPLRLRQSTENVVIEFGSGDRTNCHESLSTTTGVTVASDDTATIEIDLLRKTVSNTTTISDSNTEKEQAGKLSSCANMLRKLSLEDIDNGRWVLPEDNTSSTDFPIDQQSLGIQPLQRSESQSPSRRRFRFENRADTSSCEQSVLSANALPFTPALQTPRGIHVKRRATQTPSPCSIPLPSSVHMSKQISDQSNVNTFCDQNGWSPFDDDDFMEMAVEMILKKDGDAEFIDLISEGGGFVEFWRRSSLSQDTAPRSDTTAVTRDQAEIVMDIVIASALQKDMERLKKSLARSTRKDRLAARSLRRRQYQSPAAKFQGLQTTFRLDSNAEVESDGTQVMFLESEESARSQNSSHPSGSPAPSDCKQPGCLCSPCECNPCQCGQSQHEQIAKQQGEASSPTEACNCDPCQCDPCRCGQPQHENTTKQQTELNNPTKECSCDPCTCNPCKCGQSQEHFVWSARRKHTVPTESCTCNPCNCDPCKCGQSNQRAARSAPRTYAFPTGSCTCDPCECDPCQCGVTEPIEARQLTEFFREGMPYTRVHRLFTAADSLNNRTASANSEPEQAKTRRPPQIGTVPSRYFSRISTDSRSTLASDTSLDETEAEVCCTGMV